MSGQRNQTGSAKSERSKAGFSLIELLIVVAVILIIAAIAIPNFIRSKMMANEAAAVQNSRNVTTAEVVYSTTYGIGFSPTLVALSGSSAIVDQNNAGLIDSVLAAGAKSGYAFTYNVLTQDALGHVTGYSLNADPLTPSTGTRHFYTDQTSVIRANETTTAGPTDPAIQ
ncbi:MAG: prepilin-type N-terminal cleavage/methylation domain-containing protein [Acidobacteriia bacterium]|nr:prepilin-type N-terminal cleavage/methylation domain-containing protein [Terriglobia bacterium]